MADENKADNPDLEALRRSTAADLMGREWRRLKSDPMSLYEGRQALLRLRKLRLTWRIGRQQPQHHKTFPRLPDRRDPSTFALSSASAARRATKALNVTTRPTSAEGKISFHFKLKAVSKLNKPGLAARHQSYIERSRAAARIDAAWLPGGVGEHEGGDPSAPVFTQWALKSGGQGHEQVAMFGTIGATRAERMAFWNAIEETERKNGRIQYRIIGELPHELDIRQMLDLLCDFTRVFRDKGLPFWVVVHKPDPGTDERNFHCHVDYYDRPVSRLPNGRWDFAVVEEKRWRNGLLKKHRPHMQPKDRGLSERRWPRTLREHFAQVSNAHMERAGISKRYDPRTYAEMGIEVEPGIHLGTKSAAMERRGEATYTGSAQADQLFKRVDRELDKRFAQQTREVVQTVVNVRRAVPFGKADSDIRRLRKVAVDWARTELLLRSLEHRQRLLQKEIAQGLGRATARREWAQTTLDDIESDSTSKRAEGLRRVVQEASDYVNESKPMYDQAEAQIDIAYGEARLIRERHDRYTEVIKEAIADLGTTGRLSTPVRVELIRLVPRPEQPMPHLIDVIQPALRHVLGINESHGVTQAMRTIQAGAMAEMHAVIEAAKAVLAVHPERYGVADKTPNRGATAPSTRSYQRPTPGLEVASQGAGRASVPTPHPVPPRMPVPPAVQTPDTAKSPSPKRLPTVPQILGAAEAPHMQKLYSRYQFKVFGFDSGLVDGIHQRTRHHIVAAVNLATRVHDRLLNEPTYLDELASCAGTVLCLPTMREAQALTTMVDAAAQAKDRGLDVHAAIAAVMDAAQPLHREYADLRRRAIERQATPPQQHDRGLDGPVRS